MLPIASSDQDIRMNVSEVETDKRNGNWKGNETMESLVINAVIEQAMFVVGCWGMFVGLMIPVITLCVILRMVESDKIKAKAYEEFKAIRNAEHVATINAYYAERDAKRAEWLKTIESWSIVETSVN